MYHINKNYMFRPLEAIIRFCPMSRRSVIHIYIICATVYQWWDLTSVACWAGISDLSPRGGWGSYAWVLHRMAGLMPFVVGGFVAGVIVALPCGGLYSITGSVARVGPLWVVWICMTGAMVLSAGDKNSKWVKDILEVWGTSTYMYCVKLYVTYV
jgi:hypothetical protein